MVPVLLLHGSGPGTTAAAWDPLVDALGERFEVIAPDLPGFGDAPRAPIEDWEDIVAPDEPCAIVGNSAGGALALMLAARGLATKVVAVGSMGYPMPLPRGLDALWGTGPTHAEARALLDLLFHDPPGDEAVDARLAAMRAQPHYRELFPQPRQRWVDALSLTPGELASIQAPVLLIHGAEDRIVPPEHSVHRLVQLLPDARAHIFGRCGHASPLEYTAEFNRLVLTFLED
ncbi:alpha/beta fold hydrolase [Solirubrobacter sp. CPCC 204708]|uniref:Alpha/beta fold hydrolase n=1 Tax=Solirubrobacter deserti TaxID=2282478 RepID=A0ABT4RHK7_9ACTN|nr:alpha/beta fold hydrolase [Solirubrobacter deserti]MBE2316489.1 alpha/beta fold hydrolase [Solirubrobacter deserti]MDA0138022.1 alpha/beta fold hydrolase [Solirubrobacter deserti]